MWALSLTEPWATFVVTGMKRYETRTWRPDFIVGQRFAVHAAKRVSHHQRVKIANSQHIRSALCLLAQAGIDPHPGHILGTVRLARYGLAHDIVGQISDREREMGDYTLAHYAWELADPERFATPIPAQGRLNFWQWHETDV